MTTTKQLTAKQACDLIESHSAKLCRAHYAGTDKDVAGGWYCGGSSHNDDRLTAEVDDDGEIAVRDGASNDVYRGDMTEADIRGYVAEWLSNVWSS